MSKAAKEFKTKTTESKVYDTKLLMGGSKTIAYTVKSKTQMTKDQIIAKINKIKDKFLGDFEIMTCVDTDMGPRDGKVFSSNRRVQLCDDYEWETASSFTIYVWKKPANTGGDGDDENDDCLYNAIAKAVTKFRLPKANKTPELLKEHLGLNRTDPVSIELIPKVELLLHVNINVVGDYVHTSATPFPTKPTVNLILSNEHYEINEEVVQTGALAKSLTKRKFELVLCDEQENFVKCYDGTDEFKISYETYLKAKREVRETGIAYNNDYVKKDKNTKRNISLKVAYNRIIKDAEHLLELTNGKYDLARSMYKVPDLIRKIISNSLTAFDEPDPITELEQHWIYSTECNSIIFAEPVQIEHAYSYDKRSCYPSVMSDVNFKFPVKQGVFVNITELPEILKYGIYRVMIEQSDNELNDRFFRFNEKNYYTHYHLYTARLLGLKMTLINDGQANALFYSKNRASGRDYVSGVVNELYNIKNESPLAKQLLSALWGVLCSKNIIKKSTKNEPLHLTTERIESIRSIGGQDVMVGYIQQAKYYKYPHARLGVFLTSCNRYKMTSLLLPHTEHIHKFHTDGFIADMPLNLDIGPDIGQWKLEKEGQCRINHVNKVEWL
jgi:hypothetical protein